MNNQAKTVISNLFEITKAFEKDIKILIDSFDTDGLLSFNESEEMRKKVLRSYNQFSLKAKKHTDKYEATVIELSLLISKSDRMCDTNLTKQLSEEFDRYSVLFKAITKFITYCEPIVLNKEASIKQTAIMQHARELLTAVQSYKKNF